MHVAEPLLQTYDSLAIGAEAEVSGLDDTGVDRTDRDLVQTLAFDRQEPVVTRDPLVPGAAGRWRRPTTVVEPGTLIDQPSWPRPAQIA